MKAWQGSLLISLFFLAILVAYTPLQSNSLRLENQIIDQTWWFWERGTALLGECNPNENYPITWTNPINGSVESGWVNPDCPITPLCVEFGTFDCGDECQQETIPIPNTTFSAIHHRGVYWSFACEDILGYTACRSQKFEPLSSITGYVDVAGILHPKRFNQTCKDLLKYNEGIILTKKNCEMRQVVCEEGKLKECLLIGSQLDWDITTCTYGCHSKEVRCQTKEEFEGKPAIVLTPVNESEIRKEEPIIEEAGVEASNVLWILWFWIVSILTYVLYFSKD